MRERETWHDRVDSRIVAALRPLASACRAFHPVRLEGLERLPQGPALLVGNHGLLGYETVLFFHAVLEQTGRLPRGLADRWFFRVPGLREIVVRVGGMLGTPQNARRALAQGEWVVSYPGGVREVLKRRNEQKYRLQWGRSLGFARVAAALGVPVVPFAAAGVDHTFDVLARVRGTGHLLMRHSKYDLPILWGVGPFPRPVPFWFRFGWPISVADLAPGDERDAPERLHRCVWNAAQRLLDELTGEWSAARGNAR